jgi:ADP-ribose pyrophosphatase YjhB (NUDIX family)
MHEIHSHCSYCGRRFPADAPWPKSCSNCGNRSYRNPLPVVVVLLPVGDGVVVIRRNTEPQKGTLTLPGGYIDFGETWQEAGVRELLEETGIDISGSELALYDVMNGLDGTLVVFGLAERLPASALRGSFTCEETQEVVLIMEPSELGFTMHTQVVGRYFEEKMRG